MMDIPWHIIGVGSGWGAGDMGTADGPKALMARCPDPFRRLPATLSYWHEGGVPSRNSTLLSPNEAQDRLNHIVNMATWLSNRTQEVSLQGRIPLVFGGDHSIAMGTWSGIKAAEPGEDIGLIWIDAHMDAHTPETSPSLNIHGMPVAVLLGYGDLRLVGLKPSFSPVLKPEHLCLIGVRSFEAGEASLLNQLGVQVYRIEDVRERGFVSVFEEALRKLPPHKFGVSIDVDGFDPTEAPGTGTPEKGGLRLHDMAGAFHGIAKNPGFLGLEIAEFNPHKDVREKTCQLVWELVKIGSGGIP